MNETQSYLVVLALQATAIVATVLVLMQCALRRPALRHALGVMGLGLLLVSPLLSFALPRPGWLTDSQPTAAPAVQHPAASGAPLTTELDTNQFDDWATPAPTSFDTSELAGSPAVDVVATEPHVESVTPGLEPAVIAPTWSERWHTVRIALIERLPALLMAAGVVWIIGAVWQLISWRRSHVRLRRLRASLVDWPAGKPIDDAAAICEQLGLRELPAVKVSEIAPMPLVLGVAQPMIVLPGALVESQAPGRLRDVVLHEAAHIARRDPLVFVVQRVVAALFWWQPGVHWLNRAINRAREEVCDNHVLHRGDAASYAELLLELVESYAGLRMELSLMGLLTGRWSLEQRIAGLLNPARDTRTRAGRVPAIAAAALLATVCVIVGGVGAFGRFQADAATETAASPSGITESEQTLVDDKDVARSASWLNFRNGDDLRGIAGTKLPENLELLWELKTHDGVTSTAAIDGGRAYVADLSGYVRCLDLRTGQEQWHFRTIESDNPEEFAPGFNAPVTLSDSAVFIGDDDGKFHALDRQTGAPLWTPFETQGEIKGGATILSADPATGVPRVMFGSHDGKLYCLNAVTSAPLWEFDTQGPVNGSQPVFGNLTYVAGCDRPVLRVVDVNSGQQQAEIMLAKSSLLIASPALVDDVLYFGTAEGELVAQHGQAGGSEHFNLGPHHHHEIRSSPAVTDELILFGSGDKRLYAIERRTGKRPWTFETRGPIDSSPVVVGDRIFFGSADRYVYAVDFTGREVWKHNGGGRISASPAVGDGHLVIGCEGAGGRILCFGAKLAAAVDETPRPAMRKVTLRGTCEDENQRPLAGVRVQVFRSATRLDPPERVAEAVTSENGRFVLEGVESNPEMLKTYGVSDLVVAATGEGRASATTSIDEKGDQVELTLTLQSNPGTLSGTVRDAAGQPVAGATVYLPMAFSQPLPGIMSAVTDDQGRYAIHDLRCWTPAVMRTNTGTTTSAYYFYVRHPDYAVTMAQNTAVPQAVDVTLHPPAVISGKVIDSVTSQPAAGVIVSAQGVARRGWAQARTEADGRYTLRLTKDHYNIWAEIPERMPIAVKALEAVSGKTAEGADIRMVRGGFVVGTLIDPATNQTYKPAEGQELRVAHYGPARPRTGAAVTSAVVEPDGTYRLRVAPGRNYVYLMSGGHGGTCIDIEDGQEVRHDFRIGERGSTESAADDPDVQLRRRLIEQAHDEDETAARRSANLPPPPAPRKRGDTPAGKLLDELAIQNAGNERFRDSWLRTLKQIVDLGPEAVPELIAELDATNDNLMLRCLGFSLRAIGDKRAVPALIRAIPKTLLPPGSDMGVRANDEELARFAKQHAVDPQTGDGLYSFGRPVREIFGALQKLTGQKFDEEELYSVFLGEGRRQRQLQRRLFEQCALRWSDWWEQHWSEHVSDAEFARVKLPEPKDSVASEAPVKEPHYKTGDGNSGYVLESALSPTPGWHELIDLDTGRAGPVPAQWRKTIGGDGHAQFVTWATEQGYDLIGYEYDDPATSRRVHAIRRLSGQFWELDDSHWKKSFDDVTLPALRQQGRAVENHWLLHFDPQAGAVDALARGTFLFETSEGTPGLLFVGVDVQDDSLQPGGRSDGDSDLQSIAFRKGRRFGFTFLDPIAEPIARATNAVESVAPAQPGPATETVKAAPAVQWGTIEGQFVLDGDVPLVPPLKTAQGEVPDDSLLVNADNKGIANVCIYLERAPAQIHPDLSKGSSEKIDFDSHKLQFVPHILTVRTDQTVLLKNSNAGVLNVRPMMRANPAINQIIAPNDNTGGAVHLTRSELKHPPLQVGSDLHPWMRAYWIVSDHPYVAVTDADGKFKVENLPVGEHTFRVWHERIGFLNPVLFQRDLKVNVNAGETVTLPVFKLPPGEFIAATQADALETECSCEFDKTPLKDITEFVSTVHQVPITLDAEVDGLASVTIKHKGTLKEMLEKMLPSLGLEYEAGAKEIVIRKKKTEK